MRPAETEHPFAQRADDLAQLAAMELLDVGWSLPDIAVAIARPIDWVRDQLDAAANEAAKPN